MYGYGYVWVLGGGVGVWTRVCIQRVAVGCGWVSVWGHVMVSMDWDGLRVCVFARTQLDEKVDKVVQEQAKGRSYGWVIPFVLLVVVVIAAAAVAYAQYRKLLKTHLL